MSASKVVLSVAIMLSFFIHLSKGFRTRIPIGVLVDSADPTAETVIRHTLWMIDRDNSWPREYVAEVIPRVTDLNDASEIDRAVCYLMKQGIMALIAPTNPLAYQILVTYSNSFQIPLVSPSFPDVSSKIRPTYSVSTEPSVTRAVIDLLRYYKWTDFVYLYDADDGPDALQKIFQLGYRALRFNLTGVMRTSHPEEANKYLRKLDSVKKYHTFHVILDMEHSLARDIIIRHVHDVHVGKTNFHFLIKRPAMEEFWANNTAEFGAMNVTGFTVLKPDKLKKFQERWKDLPSDVWPGAGTSNLNMSAYFYHDASVILAEGFKKLLKRGVIAHTIDDADAHLEIRDCLQDPAEPLRMGRLLTEYIKRGLVTDGLTGRVVFDFATGQRKQYELFVMTSSRKGSQVMAKWSDVRGLQPNHLDTRYDALQVLPRIGEKKKYKVASVLSPPFMMVKSQTNSSSTDNRRKMSNDDYEGFCKDLLDMLATEVNFDYDLHVLEPDQYGIFDESVGEWTGAVGELIRGKADIVVADLHVTGRRQRVVEFIDPFAALTLSIVMKNPQQVSSGSSAFFLLSAFSKEVWVCILMSTLVVATLFYLMSKFTGAPDNIEATSRVWGKRFTVTGSAWFTIGSALMQGTGVYPRSSSCRVLGGTWWCFTLLILSLYIASLTSHMYMDSTDQNGNTHLARLNSLSLESVVKESIRNDWPRVGIKRNSTIRKFLQQSTIPVYKEYTEYLKNKPEVVMSTVHDGVDAVRKSKGEYAFLTESLLGDYYSTQEPCDVISIHDTVAFTTYAIAAPLWSPRKFEINEGLSALTLRGELGTLHRKWFIENGHCGGDRPRNKNVKPASLLTMSGLFLVILVGLVFVAMVGSAQFYFKIRKKEERRAKLSFEEVAMGSALPLPPPELLLEPSAEDDNGMIDGWAERRLVPSSFVGDEDVSPHRSSSASRDAN